MPPQDANPTPSFGGFGIRPRGLRRTRADSHIFTRGHVSTRADSHGTNCRTYAAATHCYSGCHTDATATHCNTNRHTYATATHCDTNRHTYASATHPNTNRRRHFAVCDTDSDAFSAAGRAAAARTTMGRSGEMGDGVDGLSFDAPNGIAIDAEDNVYTTEFQGHRVRKFTPEGELLVEWGGLGTEPGQFIRPTGIVVGPDGRIYVAESGGHRVQVFSSEGTFLDTWGADGFGPASSFQQWQWPWMTICAST